jgi:glycosyltransferase involved in cell wall biosynthesis
VNPPAAPAVLQVLPALGVAGGVERGTVDVAKALVAAGWRAVVASEGGPLVRELERAGATHVTLPLASKNPFVMRKNIGRLRTLIAQETIDIVHARSRAPAWSAAAAAKKEGVHFITTFHGFYSEGSSAKRLYNAVMTRGERVIAISDFIADHIVETYGTDPAKIRVIHRGVDINQFDPARVSEDRIANLVGQWRLPEERHIVLLPGRLSTWKGQEVLIKALARLRRRDVFAILVGIGGGSAELRAEIEGAIVRGGLEDSVRLIDECRDMPAAYLVADVVVTPSTRPEAFGRTVTEAQAMGRPVIAADHGGARETIVPGLTGRLVPPIDPDALATAIAEVIALDGEAREKLGRQSMDHVRRYFTNEAMCAATLRVYEELLDMPAHARAAAVGGLRPETA